MHAELKYIDSNDYGSWERFVSASRQEPSDDHGWFTVEVGPDDGIPDGEMFQVFIVTAAAISRVKPARGPFRCVVAPSFKPEIILNTLREHLAAISGRYWEDVRERVRKSMWWEWEDMKAAP